MKVLSTLERNGQYRAIVVQKKTGRILAGHGTVEAARELGWTEILAHQVQCSTAEAKRIVLVDNRANDLAGYDDQALADLLGSLGGKLDGTGYDDQALSTLLAGLQDTAGNDMPPGKPPSRPKTRSGDLYTLCSHRLLCGDATSPGDVKRLLGGGTAACMWTDPPYGVDYVGKTKDALTIDSDGAAGLEQLLAGAFANAATALSAGSPVYCAHPAGAHSLVFTRRFAETFALRQGLVWNKGQMVLGHADYHYSHEPILYGYTGGAGRRGRGGAGWYGDNSQVSVIDVPKPSASTEHPTSKPVELIEHCLRNSTLARTGVLDLFAGSGSTLIACENLARQCYAMEIDPVYCDVIVERWERHTGLKATRERA